jgi:hypothetical protein
MIMENGHEAHWVRDGDEFLVVCPEWCNLGESRRQATQDGAEKRIQLHRLASAPLVPVASP